MDHDTSEYMLKETQEQKDMTERECLSEPKTQTQAKKVIDMIEPHRDSEGGNSTAVNHSFRGRGLVMSRTASLPPDLTRRLGVMTSQW